MIAGLFVLGALFSGWAPNHSKQFFSPPPPLNIEFRLDDNGPGLGVAHQWLNVTIEYIDQGEDDGFYEECTNYCLGHVHSKHTECDTSCDEPCPEKIHDGYFYPELFDDDNYETLKQRLATSGGSSLPPDFPGAITHLVWQDMFLPLDADQYNYEAIWSCWNKSPCSTAYRGFPTHDVLVRVSYVFSSEGGMSPRTAGAKGTVDLVKFEVPDTTKPEDGTDIYCNCSPFANLMTDSLRKYYDKYQTGLVIGDNRLLTNEDISTYGLHITCPDMNTCNLSAINPTGMPVTFHLFPGTQLISSDPMSQNMMAIHDIKLMVGPWQFTPISTPIAEVAAGQQKGPLTGEGSAVCINMKKHAPTDKVGYTFGKAQVSALKMLGKGAANDRILGPWTQTKFWIASDAATFEDVQKAMFPKPTEGHYLRALYDVGHQTHINFAKEPHKKCLEPRVIVGQSASRKATLWFVQTMAKVDPDALANWVKGNPTAFKDLFADDAPDYATRHAADIANALCSSKNSEVQMAGFDYLLNAVPEAKRASMATSGGLQGMTFALMSENETTVKRALDVAEVYKAKELRLGLSNLSTKVSEPLRARALAIYKGL